MFSEGGEHSEEAWINLIYWLTEKGGINFVVLVETLPAESQISNQLKCLLTNKKITVLLMPLDRLISNEDAIQLIQNTNESAPVDSIFFVFFEIVRQFFHGFFIIFHLLPNHPIFLLGLTPSNNRLHEYGFSKSCEKYKTYKLEF